MTFVRRLLLAGPLLMAQHLYPEEQLVSDCFNFLQVVEIPIFNFF